jgi:indolepyruvate ferredoxin oxidoreductase alpha subunit
MELTVTGDIGCYTLGALPPLDSLHTCLCMGSGITFFEGFRKAVGNNVVGVIGDSTFVHSGISGLINLAYNGTKGVVIILDNGTTAMTGSQPHPGTGETSKGKPAKQLILEDMCRAAGADNVDVVNSYKTSEFETLLKQRLAENSLSIIITRAKCVILLKREQKKS